MILVVEEYWFKILIIFLIGFLIGYNIGIVLAAEEPTYTVCGIADILTTFKDQNRIISEYFCHTA